MAKLKWGKPKIEVVALVEGAIPETPVWIELKNIVEDSTKLSSADGTVVDAPVEGGALLASRKAANKYTLECELYANDAVAKPIDDVDGVVASEYAVRLTPEDTTLKGKILDRTSVSLSESFDAKIGEKWKYTFTGIKPSTGTIVKDYTPA